MRRSVSSLDDETSPPTLRGRRPWDRIACGCAVLAGELAPATSALTDPAANPEMCWRRARSWNIMRPLRFNPVVAQVAQIVNRSTGSYLSRPPRESRSLTPLRGAERHWLRQYKLASLVACGLRRVPS